MTKKDKKEEKKYQCTRCGTVFTINHEVDKESAVCNKCFELIKGSKTYEEYKNNRQPII